MRTPIPELYKCGCYIKFVNLQHKQYLIYTPDPNLCI